MSNKSCVSSIFSMLLPYWSTGSTFTFTGSSLALYGARIRSTQGGILFCRLDLRIVDGGKKIRGHPTEKLSENCQNLYLWVICPILGTFWNISQSDELGSFFRLLRWDRGSNTLLLSTKKPTFRTTWILTYIGPSNILEGKKLRSKSKKLNFRLQNLIQYIYI